MIYIVRFTVLLFIFGWISAEAEWSFNADGVSFDVGEDGEINRIYAKHSEPVNFPDRRGVETAKTIAEERAKARIIRFVEESVSDETAVYELELEAQQAIAQSESNRSADSEATPSVSREAVRTTLRSIERMTRSVAEGKLRGVVRLEESYDPDKELVYVVVGISQKSMQAAGSLEDFLGGSSASIDNQGDPKGNAISQDRETKKIADDDW